MKTLIKVIAWIMFISSVTMGLVTILYSAALWLVPYFLLNSLVWGKVATTSFKKVDDALDI